MSTLGQLVSETRSRQFIGRSKELALFSQFLSDNMHPPVALLSYWGQAGMGKSSLLARIEVIAQSSGVGTVVIDFRRQATPLLFLRSLHSQLPYNEKSDAVDKIFRDDFGALEEINTKLLHAFAQEQNADPDKPTDVVAQWGQTTGKVIGEFASTETGLPLLGLLGAASGNALGAQVTRWRLRKLAAVASISEDDLAFVAASTERLTAAVLASLTHRSDDGEPCVILLDHHEYASPAVDDWLRADLLPGLPTSAKVVVFRRRPFTDLRSWEEFAPTIHDAQLKPFDDAEAIEFWGTRGVDDPVKALALHQVVKGHPYKSDIVGALIRRHDASSLDVSSLRALSTYPDIEERLMARYLEEVGSPEEKQLLRICAVPRWFDNDLLMAIAPEAAALYDQLRNISFVETHQDGGLALHSLAREAILKQERASNPLVVQNLQRTIADHLALRRRNAGRLGLEYLRDEVYHRLSYSEEDGIAFAISVIRGARLIGLHGIEDNVWVEIADFDFTSAHGTAWRHFAIAHSSLRRGDWNEASRRVEQLSAATWPDEEFVLWLTELRLELLTGRGSYDDARELEDDALSRVRHRLSEPSPSLAFEIFDLEARHVETCAILSRFDEAFTTLDAALSRAGESTPAAARLLLAGAAACRLKGEVARGLELSQNAVAINRANGDPRALCFALIQQSRLETHDGRWARACQLLDEARELELSAPDQYNRANIILFRANILRKRNLSSEALADYEASLTLHLTMRSDREIAPLFGSLGLVYLALGDSGTARSYIDQSLTMKSRQSYHRGVGISRNYLGLVHIAGGEVDRAREQFNAGMLIGATYDLGYLVQWSRLGLSRCALRTGTTDDVDKPHNVAIETATRGFGADILAAQILYDSVFTKATSNLVQTEGLESALKILLDYNPFWAYEVTSNLMKDLKSAPVDSSRRMAICEELSDVASGSSVVTLEQAARVREEVPVEVDLLAGRFIDE